MIGKTFHKKWQTSEEAKETYTYLPADIEYPDPMSYEFRDMDADEMKALVKIFDPSSPWTWFVCAYEPESERAYGYVYSGLTPDFNEFGFFSVRELSELKGGMGLPMERDIHWDPDTPISKVIADGGR